MREALQWWVRQLDVLFTTLTDVTPIQQSRLVLASGQLNTLLTVEQLFRHVQSRSADGTRKRFAGGFALAVADGWVASGRSQRFARMLVSVFAVGPW